MLLAQTLVVGCAGTNNRAQQEEQFALLENQRIADELAKEEAIRNSFRTQLETNSSTDNIDIQPQQFLEWNFQLYPDPATAEQVCTLLSDTYEVDSNGLETLVQILITQSAIYLRTDAVLSPDGVESGFRVDANLPVAFDNFLDEVTAKVDDGYNQLINSMSAGTVLSVSFSYQQLGNSSPVTHTIDLDLAEFNNAHELFSLCL